MQDWKGFLTSIHPDLTPSRFQTAVLLLVSSVASCASFTRSPGPNEPSAPFGFANVLVAYEHWSIACKIVERLRNTLKQRSRDAPRRTAGAQQNVCALSPLPFICFINILFILLLFLIVYQATNWTAAAAGRSGS